MSETESKNHKISPIPVSSLIQLFPLAIGVNILAYGIITTGINLIPFWLGFILVFFIITTDSIVEYGAYNFNELPKSLYYLAILNTLSITGYAVCLGIMLNPNFKAYITIGFGWSFVMLALESFAEMLFCIVYGRIYDKIKEFALYEREDYQKYYIVEVASTILYSFSAIFAFFNVINFGSLWVPYVIACLQLAEQFWWVGLKSKPTKTMVNS